MEESDTKSLWDSTLDLIEGLRDDDGSTPGDTRNADGPAPGYTAAELEITKERLEINFSQWLDSQLTGRAELETQAWLCVHCGLINGFISKSKEIRKTCLKCRKPRLDTNTVISLLAEDFKENLAR